MAYCANCGAQTSEGAKFCPSCGAASQRSNQSGYQPNAMNASSDANDAQNNKAMGILAYLGILVLIPVFAAKESKFARYHANQGLVLALAEVALAIVYSILAGIFAALIFSTGSLGIFGILTSLLGLLSLAFLVLAIIGIINAANGNCKPLPLIGGITLLK